MWKDGNGAWVRTTEQRFRAFAVGRINLEVFLDTECCFVFTEEDLSVSVVVVGPNLTLEIDKPLPLDSPRLPALRSETLTST